MADKQHCYTTTPFWTGIDHSQTPAETPPYVAQDLHRILHARSIIHDHQNYLYMYPFVDPHVVDYRYRVWLRKCG